MNFDLIYNEIGEFGTYQKYVVYAASVTSLYAGLLYINTIFVLAIPAHRIVCCLAYYGLALNSGEIGGNIFLNFFLQALMDLPANIIVVLWLDKTGRKPMFMASMIIGGLGCISTIFPMLYGGKDLQILTTVLALVGKVGASAGFSVIYIYSAEIFPTVVRNAGMGSSSCMARLGGMVAPYIADLDRLVGGPFGKALPQMVFGSLSIVAGLLAIYLPETLHKQLPETIQEAEHFGSEKSEDTYEKPKSDDEYEYEESEEHVNTAFDATEWNTRL